MPACEEDARNLRSKWRVLHQRVAIWHRRSVRPAQKTAAACRCSPNVSDLPFSTPPVHLTHFDRAPHFSKVRSVKSPRCRARKRGERRIDKREGETETRKHFTLRWTVPIGRGGGELTRPGLSLHLGIDGLARRSHEESLLDRLGHCRVCLQTGFQGLVLSAWLRESEGDKTYVASAAGHDAKKRARSVATSANLNLVEAPNANNPQLTQHPRLMRRTPSPMHCGHERASLVRDGKTNERRSTSKLTPLPGSHQRRC